MRRPADGRAGADRWLLSYADLMTLLFALSVTMYAAAAEEGPRVQGPGIRDRKTGCRGVSSGTLRRRSAPGASS